MEIWIVEEGDRYEGPYRTEYFKNEKDAFAFARTEYKIKEFTRSGVNHIAWRGGYEYISVSPATLRMEYEKDPIPEVTVDSLMPMDIDHDMLDYN